MESPTLPTHSADDEMTGICLYTLLLATMAGADIKIVVSVSIHHRWDMLEDYLVGNLETVSHLDTLGCDLPCWIRTLNRRCVIQSKMLSGAPLTST